MIGRELLAPRHSCLLPMRAAPTEVLGPHNLEPTLRGRGSGLPACRTQRALQTSLQAKGGADEWNCARREYVLFGAIRRWAGRDEAGGGGDERGCRLRR